MRVDELYGLGFDHYRRRARGEAVTLDELRGGGELFRDHP